MFGVGQAVDRLEVPARGWRADRQGLAGVGKSRNREAEGTSWYRFRVGGRIVGARPGQNTKKPGSRRRTSCDRLD